MTRPVPHAREMLPDQKKNGLTKPRPDPSLTSPATVVAAACHGVRAVMPLDIIVIRKNPIVFGTAVDSP